ncbi:MAG: sigma 54-interacting transcriptional regulator [Kofleriaceae bacterium]
MVAAASPGPDVLARFRIDRVVGRGTSGRVLRVTDLRTGEPRALKLVHERRHERGLLAEFEQLTRLSHPALPQVFEVGRTQAAIEDVAAGAAYFVAEWIDGTRSDHAEMSTDRALAIWSLLADIAGALATIHAAGLVHADVAPQNVLFGSRGHVLVDLGLSSGIGARGTPMYMAPEALAGQPEPRSDLYGLGLTALRMIRGQPVFQAPNVAELVRSIMAGAPPLQLPGVPRALADLLTRMISLDVDGRPRSALSLLDELDELAPAIAPGSKRRARPKVGPPPAAASWPGARDAIAAIAASLDATNPVVVVVGSAEAGTRQIVADVVGRWQLGQVARGASAVVSIGSLDDVAARLGVAARADDRGWLDRVAHQIRTASELQAIELGTDPRAQQLVTALARGERRRPVIVTTDRELVLAPAIAVHRVPPLTVDGLQTMVAAMLGTSPPAGWTRALHAACGGQVTTAIELLRAVAADDPLAIDWTRHISSGAAQLRARQVASVSAGARMLATAIAAWGDRARLDRVLELVRDAEERAGLAELAELARAGLAQRHGDDVAIDPATAAVLPANAIDALATKGARALTRSTGDLTWAAPLFERAQLDKTAAELACDISEQLTARGRSDRAIALARRAIGSLPARAGLIAARAAAATAQHELATAFASEAQHAGADPIEAELIIARAAQRAGDLDRAEAILAHLHRRDPGQDEVAGTYARLLVTRSRYAEARVIASASAAPPVGLRAEAAGLAAFYLGQLDDADAAFAALELGAAAASDPATAGRALSLRGMVAQQRGQLALASDRYREAARKLTEVGELHAAAVAELNLGTALSERGRASEALPRLAAAERVFSELGAVTELCGAELNRANALIAVGQLNEASEAAAEALVRAEGAPHLRAFALLIAGDARRHLGDLSTAATLYRDALALGTRSGDAHVQISAHVALAEAGFRDSDGVDVASLCSSADDRDRWTIARGRLALHTGLRDERVTELAGACQAAAQRAVDADRLERAFRGYAVAAQLASAAGDRGRAQSFGDRARSAHAAIVAAAAPAFRTALQADRDLLALPIAAIATEPVRPARSSVDAHLRRLLTLSRRLNSEASVERILDEVIDTAIDLTHAERGFLLLRQPSGELAPVVSRNFAAGDLDAGATPSVSRSIAERAAQSGEPVMTVDAGVDERFGMAASVAALRLRSVLAVPLRQRGTITGCIYVDHRLRGGAFDDDAAGLIGELADIAAIAIENARLTEDLRRTTSAVEQLNGRLSAELAERDAELVRVKADLPDRARLRNSYDAIIGTSPAMVRMLGLVDRAAATALPVVIVGESGTGKELVARALHDHGPRKAGPFVAINCSAVPEPLLESELFGHVRGAFTGADRDRRGMFEVADGGTLFLDEVAETSLAMQAKLLRVLQDGMIRRVGDTAARKVDVRVVAATQRSLAELASAGAFREDLRFRIEVITIAVPALRDRETDVPLLVDHLLARAAAVAGTRPAKLTHAARRALGQHRWPGNVRELENAIARGIAMGGDVIDVTDLPEAIALASARPEPAKPMAGDDLRLKPALQSTEQAYIEAAMERAKGNQTVAARLLGLSRFGLQKKLRRRIEDDSE